MKQWQNGQGLYTFSGAAHGPGVTSQVSVTCPCAHARPPDRAGEPEQAGCQDAGNAMSVTGVMWPVATTTTAWPSSSSCIPSRVSGNPGSTPSPTYVLNNVALSKSPTPPLACQPPSVFMRPMLHCGSTIPVSTHATSCAFREKSSKCTPRNMTMKPTRSESIVVPEVVLKPWKRISKATIVAVREAYKVHGIHTVKDCGSGLW